MRRIFELGLSDDNRVEGCKDGGAIGVGGEQQHLEVGEEGSDGGCGLGAVHLSTSDQLRTTQLSPVLTFRRSRISCSGSL